MLIISIIFIAIVGEQGGFSASFVFFAIVFPVSAVYLCYKELDEKVKKKHLLIRMEFPNFVNKLLLFVNAGMNVSKAWEKIVVENTTTNPLYEELAIVMSSIQSGKGESTAYEDFAKRCAIPEVTKFVTIVIQNLKKGTGDFTSILRLLSNESFELRKTTARRLGEEASTKLLLPMMIMFFAILIITVTPAILAMRNI